MRKYRMINSIQILRGLAASLVVFIHAIHDVSLFSKDSIFVNFFNLSNFGNIGVDIFFCISGFIMIYIHYNDFERKKSSKNFLFKRIIRIVPLYWLFTTISAILLIFLPQLFSNGKVFDLNHYLYSLAFIPSSNSLGEIVPVLGVGWTLNIEMYFYLIFSLALIFNRKYFLYFLFICLTINIMLNYYFDYNVAYFQTNGKLIIYEFFLGSLIGYLYCNKRILPNGKIFLIVSLLLISINLFVFIDFEYRFFYAGLPSALLLYSLVSIKDNLKYENLTSKIFLLVGNASYSIYLTHVFFYKLPIKFLHNLNHDLLIILSLLISILFGILIYKFIEEPSYKYLKRKLYKKEEEK